MVIKKYSMKNGEELMVRNANKEDAKKLIEYIKKVSTESDFLTFGEGEFDITLEKEEEFIEDCLKSNNKLCIIGEVNGKIVGNLSFRSGVRPRIKHTGELGISVLKEYWGVGIGKILMQYLIDWAKNSGIIRKINLRVREDNHKGIKLYKKLGFKEEGRISRDICVNGIYYTCITMGLDID